VLEKGKIVEEGNTTSAEKGRRKYAKLHKTQMEMHGGAFA